MDKCKSPILVCTIFKAKWEALMDTLTGFMSY